MRSFQPKSELKLGSKAVTTALTSIMLLSLVLALTSGVYVLTARGVNQTAILSKTAFAKGANVSGEFAKEIERGGLGAMPVSGSGEYEYGNLANLSISIQRSPAYVKGIPAFFRVILENPTTRVVKVPVLRVTMQDAGGEAVELSAPESKNFGVAGRWGDANPIGFTPAEPGEYTIHVELKDGTDTVAAQNTIAIRVTATPPAAGEAQNEGETRFTVLELNTSAYAGCNATILACEESRDDTGIREGRIDHKTKDVVLGLAKKSASSSGDRSATFEGISDGTEHTAPYIYETLVEPDGRYAESWSTRSSVDIHGVIWRKNGTRALVAVGGSYPSGYNLWLSSFNASTERLMTLTKNILQVCDGGRSLTDGWGAAGQLCSCVKITKTWALGGGYSYSDPADNPMALYPQDNSCVHSGAVKYAKMQTASFTLPDANILNATLYVVPNKDFSVKISVNNKLLTQSWLPLLTEQPAKLDVTSLAVPGSIGNKLEAWINPNARAGNYTIRWGVQVEEKHVVVLNE